MSASFNSSASTCITRNASPNGSRRTPNVPSAKPLRLTGKFLVMTELNDLYLLSSYQAYNDLSTQGSHRLSWKNNKAIGNDFG
jgi:hypothetical protein